AEHARRADGDSRIPARVGGGARAGGARRPVGGGNAGTARGHHASGVGRVERPLAPPTILAGGRTASVINVGTATLGGFIGAGGYGRPILRGIDKFDVPLMLEGAIPAAIMALGIEGLFGLAGRLAPGRG